MRFTHYDEHKKRWQVNIDYGAVMIDELNYAIGEAIDKLAAYEDAKEQGQLVILPCKVGDTVYYLTGNPTLASGYHFNRVESTKCIGFYWDRSGLRICLQMPKGNHGTYGRFGETIFLAREEAEAALTKEDTYK